MPTSWIIKLYPALLPHPPTRNPAAFTSPRAAMPLPLILFNGTNKVRGQ